MKREWSRRTVLLAIGATMTTACAPRASASAPHAGEAPPDDDPLAKLEASVGGRVGVFALDTANGKHLARRENERFAMCSTFKWPLAAAVLQRVDRRELSLDDRIAFGPGDLLDHAPRTRAHVAEGSMTIAALAEAAVTTSDNTAANLLLAKVGGPPGMTALFRQLGDAVTRLDRTEMALNTNVPGDPRDTTSPRAMAGLLRAVLCGDALSPRSRAILIGWMIACETGHERIRAGLPAGWSAGDKTGTGDNGAVNDCAYVVPPGRAPIVIAVYMSDGPSSVETLSSAHAEIGRLVAKAFG